MQFVEFFYAPYYDFQELKYLATFKHIDKISTRTSHIFAEMYFKQHSETTHYILSTDNDSKSQNELFFETTIREFFWGPQTNCTTRINSELCSGEIFSKGEIFS